MKRRVFNKLITALGLSSSLKKPFAATFSNRSTKSLPDVVDNGNSVERCINSRYSFHGGYSAALPESVTANVIWAALNAPLIADERQVYAALSDNLYLCSQKDNSLQLEVHSAGDKRVDSSSAFQVGVSTTPENVPEDAGVAHHFAQLASVAFWKGTSDQPASLPSEAAWNVAKTSWNTATKIHLVSCFGLSKTVKGIKSECVAISSDTTLPDPKTDGTVSFEAAVKNLRFGTEFSSDELKIEEISQLLWASYGVTPHTVIGGNNAANAVASHTALYFLAGKIYLVSSSGVNRFHIRKTPNDKVNRDHRLEGVRTDDVRGALRSALKNLPTTAPVYIVFCGSVVEDRQLMEAGFAGAGALLQATALGLQGHYIGRFSDAERSAVQTACSIPKADLPMVVFSAGHAEGTGKSALIKDVDRSSLFSAVPSKFSDYTLFTVDAKSTIRGEICVYDIAGRIVRRLRLDNAGKVRWDGCDRNGVTVAKGMYTCVLTSVHGTMTVEVIKR